MSQDEIEMIEGLKRKGIDVCLPMTENDEIMIFTFSQKEVKIAKEIVKEYNYKLQLYMPGSKIDNKAAEYDLIKR